VTISGTTLTLASGRPLHAEVVIEASGGGKTLTERFWYVVQPSDAPAYPLSVSANQRYLVDKEGEPVIIHGDAAWELPTNRTKEEATRYFRDRREKGFTAGIWRIITTTFTNQAPGYKNVYEESPFSSTVNGELDFTDPNAAYWAHIDWCFREAYRHGQLIFASPAYIGYSNGEEGWTDALIANGAQRMNTYGEWLGTRYANYPNIIWVTGGDSDLEDEVEEHNAMVEGIAAGETNTAGEIVHLVTAKSKRGQSAVDDYGSSWLTLNSTYSKGTYTSSETNIDYFERSPVMPTFYVEGWYENEHGMTARQLRRQYYWALLEGASGHIYGNCPVWNFGGARYFCDDPDAGVEASYDSPGAQDASYLAALLQVRTLLFDGGAYMHVDTGDLVIREKGEPGTSDYVPARYNGRVAVAYFPKRKSITVDLSQLSAVTGRVRAAWYNPDEGTSTTIGFYPNSATEPFYPPSSGDWVLLLDDADLGLELPNPADLPVEIGAFEAVRDGDAVRLAWLTLSETNNAGFAIERRSTSMSGFTEIGFVEGKGTTPSSTSYRYIDPDPPFYAQNLLYRLRQVDTDGTVSHSESVEVHMRAPRDVVLHAPFPNPVQERATIRFTVPTPRRVRLTLHDVLGRRVQTLIDRREEGRGESMLNTDDLASGRYVIQLEAGGQVRTQHITVVR
jgi:hypothetical protein